MVNRMLSALIVLLVALSFATITFAQDSMKQAAPKEEKKMEMSKTEMAAGPMKSVSCDPTCGFMCRSHNEKELISIVKKHAKTMHKMDLTDAKIKEMMKTEEPAKQ